MQRTKYMSEAIQIRGKRSKWLWWGLFAICVFYAAFALAVGFGLAEAEKQRAHSASFTPHALAGAAVLITGPLQFNQFLRQYFTWLHRTCGLVYIAAVWVSSIASLFSAAFFDVSIFAKASFILLASLWFAITTKAYWLIRKRQFAQHRAWMIRSFALSLFFVTFSFWVPGLAVTSLPADISYGLAVTLSWALNLLIAEIWIIWTKRLAH